MGLVYRKSLRLGRKTRVNLSKSGASMSRRAGRLSVSSRGRGSIRLLPGWSFRFKLW